MGAHQPPQLATSEFDGNRRLGPQPYSHEEQAAAVAKIAERIGEIRRDAFVEPPLRARRIAIIGYAETSWPPESVWADQTIEKWTLNHGHNINPRWDRLFEFHDRKVIDEESVAHFRGVDQWAVLRGEPTRPIYMRERQDDVPCSVRFDLQAFTSYFGSQCDKLARRPYVEMAAGFMLGYAIMRLAAYPQGDPAAIQVYGFELFDGEEYCVAPGTRVLTADLNWVPAGCVQVGDQLVGFEEQSQPQGGRDWRRATVESVVPLRRPCYRVILADGSVLISSAEHRWLAASGSNYEWRTTEALAHTWRGLHTHLAKVVEPWNGPVHSWDAGYLAAAFDGEGHVGGNLQKRGSSGALGYAQKKNAMSAAVERSLDLYGFKWGRRGGDVRQYRIAGGKTEVLRFLGQVRPQRLLEKFDIDRLGLMRSKRVRIESVEKVGEADVVGIGTSTGTFVAEGFASHNSHQRACFEFYAGWAMGLGIRLTVPEKSAIFASRGLYAYDTGETMRLLNQADQYLGARFTEVTATFHAARERNEQAVAEMQTASGILQEIEQERKFVRHLIKGGDY